jgi:3-methyl-2-oxobutanoate hydroxymethyltransferase
MKVTLDDLISRKNSDKKISMLTSYDYPTARLLDQCGVDVQLIGDSVGTNVLGYTDVSMVTVPDILHHLKAVVRGAKKSFILCDMPFCAVKTKEDTLENAQRFADAGAEAVKIESERCAIEKISNVVSKGIPVCAHIGYTPQTPGLKASIQGKDIERATELVNLAKQCVEAGAFMIVLELIPERLAKVITREIAIPTIGIGAGRYCDGQVQVILDLLGMSERVFRHVNKYANISELYTDAVSSYINDVQNGYFPTEKNISTLPDDVINHIVNWIKESKKDS